MFCIISFLILSIIGIFSASHRVLAKEAFDCVFRRITLRPCNTGFQEKMKAKITGQLLPKSVFLARLFNKHFELLAWLLFLITLVSIFWTGKGLFNFYMYGSCNGLNKSGFCALDPTGQNNKTSQAGGSCTIGEGDESKVTLEDVNLSTFPTKSNNEKNTVVFVGCFNCDYTRKAYPLVKKLIEKNKVNFIFAHYPVKGETVYMLPIGYCAYKQDQGKYWQLVDKLFSSSKEENGNPDYLNQVLIDLGYSLESIQSCAQSQETKTAVVRQRIELEKTNIYGTPLVFINSKGLVGPKPYRVYDRILNTINIFKNK
jgi:protein-disulfide isomerase